MIPAEQTGGVLRWIAGVFVPMFARPTRPVALAWLLHVLLVLVVLVGAFLLQTLTGFLSNWMGLVPPLIQPVFLPLLMATLYALAWAAAWLWAQLVPEQAAVVYPDLDEAWGQALDALQRAGIGIADTPVFLVIGELPDGFDPLFRALPRQVAVAGGTPSDAPIRVYANADAIYLTLAGASLLGAQEAGDIVDLTSAGGYASMSDSVGATAGQSVGYAAGAGASIGMGMGGSMGASVSASLGASMGGGQLRKIHKIIQRAKVEGRDLTDDEKAEIRTLSAGEAAAPAAPKAPTRKAATVSVLQNPELVAEAEGRLSYLCKKVADSRWPLCPINGLILAVPVSSLDGDNRAVQWGAVARQDLTVIESSLRLRFPVFALIGGMELLPGGGPLFATLGAEKGNQRLGKGFPLNPDGTPEQIARGIEATAGWVLGGLLPYWALRYTRVTGGPNDTDDNAGAVRFLTESGRRGPALGRLLSQAVAGGHRMPTFGGCYLVVGTVKEVAEAKFARDFFKKVEASQAAVAWTDDAYAVDAGYRRWTLLGYVALAVILLAVAALAVFVFTTHKF